MLRRILHARAAQQTSHPFLRGNQQESKNQKYQIFNKTDSSNIDATDDDWYIAVSRRRPGLLGIVSVRSRPGCDLFDRRLRPAETLPDIGCHLRSFGNGFPGLSRRMSLFLRLFGLRKTRSRYIHTGAASSIIHFPIFWYWPYPRRLIVADCFRMNKLKLSSRRVLVVAWGFCPSLPKVHQWWKRPAAGYCGSILVCQTAHKTSFALILYSLFCLNYSNRRRM